MNFRRPNLTDKRVVVVNFLMRCKLGFAGQDLWLWWCWWNSVEKKTSTKKNKQKEKRKGKKKERKPVSRFWLERLNRTVPTVPTLGLGVTLELRRTGGGGFTVLTDARRVTRVGPAKGGLIRGEQGEWKGEG